MRANRPDFLRNNYSQLTISSLKIFYSLKLNSVELRAVTRDIRIVWIVSFKSFN